MVLLFFVYQFDFHQYNDTPCYRPYDELCSIIYVIRILLTYILHSQHIRAALFPKITCSTFECANPFTTKYMYIVQEKKTICIVLGEHMTLYLFTYAVHCLNIFNLPVFFSSSFALDMETAFFRGKFSIQICTKKAFQLKTQNDQQSIQVMVIFFHSDTHSTNISNQ